MKNLCNICFELGGFQSIELQEMLKTSNFSSVSVVSLSSFLAFSFNKRFL